MPRNDQMSGRMTPDTAVDRHRVALVGVSIPTSTVQIRAEHALEPDFGVCKPTVNQPIARH